ncbi:MAG: Putative uncharacterized protein TTHA1760 [uncultured Gemmatimonadaceae bacterium]|uniref:Molybdopterin oxidoreductase n=1 Tax=uncultured Gemmatimonadaceae bacterium TaxID=246130 RepID=A0A6J4KPB1_9BACT|nr:MAG: Putative uncharacterized protein TTHA1760 [uncultured Gemmatimonadaceae bacterium]
MSAHSHAHAPSREEVLRLIDRPVPARIKTLSIAFAAIGTLAFLAGLFLAPDRAWRAFHINWLYFTAISSAGVMFVAVQRITTARWSRPIIRFLEGYVAFLPVSLLFLVLILTVGSGQIFPWTHEAPPVDEKQFWLSHGFVVARDIVSFALLVALSVWYIYTCVRLDVGVVPEERRGGWARGLRARMRQGFGDERRELHSTHSRQGWLAVVLALVFGYVWTLLAFDLDMALDMHFQSTLYGWWFFMTGWIGALMSFSLITMAWRRYLMADDLITETHFHDLGKLCFAFTAFWGYLTFSQFLIIWYGNMAEETHWPRLRLIAPWKGVTFSAVMLAFAAPFFGLISKAAKLFFPTFILFAVCSLVGTWLQRYVTVYPSLYGTIDALPFGIWEIGIALMYLGIWGLCYTAFMEAFPKMRVVLQTSPYRDEVQVPVDPKTMEPLPAHE